MGRVTLFEVMFGIVFMLSTFWSNSANATDTGSGLAIAEEQLGGESLIRMGEKMNSTLIKLLGKSFVNFELEINEKICKIDPCDQWSPWNECSANMKNTFGFRSRSRVCWLEKRDTCNRTGEQTVENDSHLCEGSCRSSYTFYNSTKSCFKLFAETLNQSAAAQVCTQEGGHLLNTDTEEKWNASVSILLSNNVVAVWIDGTRTSGSAKWVFQNGKDPEANGVMSKWQSGEPNGDSCRVIHLSSSKFYWYDSVCSSGYKLICEVK
ncbi:hypothetical protein DPMN_135402 [Dreissena polymorpha]|uniref:C-type lectin domain-containing protein n=1 Tax=Dreissena polymorpha TaxID=45954 RepID=A0A9D4FXK9_DREPO|nr:hypothetical protein DPMN_135402 [Dreissena polymorpha]